MPGYVSQRLYRWRIMRFRSSCSTEGFMNRISDYTLPIYPVSTCTAYTEPDASKSIEIPTWQKVKHNHNDRRSQKPSNKRLQYNSSLDIKNCWLLDRRLAVEDPTREAPLLVLHQPRLVFVRIRAP